MDWEKRAGDNGDAKIKRITRRRPEYCLGIFRMGSRDIMNDASIEDTMGCHRLVESAVSTIEFWERK